MEDVEPVSFTSDSKNCQTPRAELLALKLLQRQHSFIEMEFHRQFYSLDMKFQEKRQLIYEKRMKIINGEGDQCDTNRDETDIAISEALHELKLHDETIKNSELLTGIPKFWLQALQNCTYNDELIRGCDEEALVHLRDVKVTLQKEPELSFKLEFEFGPNPFFENTILTKQYLLNCDLDDEFYGFSVVKAIGCEIKWKNDQNILEKTTESFFTFFNPTQIVTQDETQPDERDLQKYFEVQQDFAIGLYIKEKLVPNAVLYYLNEIDEVDEVDEIDETDEAMEKCETFDDTTTDSSISTTNI